MFKVVGPSDGSAYVIPYYGAGVTVVRSTNETYLLPQADWHNITWQWGTISFEDDEDYDWT